MTKMIRTRRFPILRSMRLAWPVERFASHPWPPLTGPASGPTQTWHSGIDMASQLFVAQVKSAKSFSEMRKLFEEEDKAELKFAADAEDWNHVLTALKSCGYEDNDFPLFLPAVQRVGSEIFLEWIETKLNCRILVQFTILLRILKDLGLLDPPPVSEPMDVPSHVCGDKGISAPDARGSRLQAPPGLCIDSKMVKEEKHCAETLDCFVSRATTAANQSIGAFSLALWGIDLTADQMSADASQDQGDPSLSSLRATEKKYVSQLPWATIDDKIAKNSELEVKPNSLPMKLTWSKPELELRMEPIENNEMGAQEDTNPRR